MHLTNKLLDYQENAVEKLKKVKVGALFMEQGTGKTITALELCRLRLEAGKVTHILWLCPCSTKQNLKDELIKQSPREMLEKITICGIETLSRSLHANSCSPNGKPATSWWMKAFLLKIPTPTGHRT